MARVLVIREAAKASATAARLEELGHEAIVLPLAGYSDTGRTLPDASFDAVTYSSATALEILANRPGGLHPLLPLPAYCVGAATAQAAASAGHREVHRAGGDGASLAALLAAHAGPRGIRRLLYPAPVHRAFDLAAALPGIAVDVVEIYETVHIDPGADDFLAALKRVSHVLLHSPRAARHFVELAMRHEGPESLRGLTLIAISEKTARAARGPGEWSVLVASAPEEGAMIALL